MVRAAHVGGATASAARRSLWALRRGGVPPHRRPLCTGAPSPRTAEPYAPRDDRLAAALQSADDRALAHELLRGLSAHGLPCFAVRPSAVSMLRSPAELHDELCSSARAARRRVHLATLYVGSGARTAELLSALLPPPPSPPPSPPPRSIHMLVDYHRAARRARDGRAPIDELRALAASAACAHVSLFRHPAGPPPSLEPFVPREACEAAGVLHAKVAVFDDDVVLTGANLSDDYFGERQDRALVLRGPAARQSSRPT
eukprot:3675533-Prymnesium_polylepis.2